MLQNLIKVIKYYFHLSSYFTHITFTVLSIRPMVNYNQILKRNWLQAKPVKPDQQWYQSLCSDSWMEPSTYGATSTQNKQPSHKDLLSWNTTKKKISPEGKRMLKEKIQEIVSYNSKRLQKEKKIDDRYKKKDKRPRCYTCRKRGHVFRNCPLKQEKLLTKQRITEPLFVSSKMNPSNAQFQEKAKYQEQVHVLTDYMVEGTEKESWDNIWYVSSAYKRHMSPMKHLFRRMFKRFKVEGVEEDERKFIVSYGVGEAVVGTGDGEIIMANVLYTPEITLNVLSMEQLEEQGFIVTYGTDRCKLKYMFDSFENHGIEEGMMEEQDDESIITSHNRFLDDYFKSLDIEEECSLIKGLEELKMDHQEDHDYIDHDYMSLNGTLYAMKVNTFPRFIAFLNLIKIDKLVFENWEVLSKRFLEMLEWFYLGFMRQSALGELPPIIGVIKVDMLGLYKFVDELGGYMNITLNNQ